MFGLKNIVKGNYLQYVRSYSFLITLAVTVYMAFSIVPSPEATYTTVRFGEFTGNYNSAWIGFVTAIMASTCVTLTGFFLVNGSIRKDIETRIGHIIGTTRISNAYYIFTKLLSNVLILTTIMLVIFAVAIVLYFLYGSSETFSLNDFIVPYVLITFPSLIVVASLALLFEIIFPKKRFLQYGFFLILYFTALFSTSLEEQKTTDVFGIQYPVGELTAQIQQLYPDEATALTIGFVSGGRNLDKVISVESLSFSTAYIFSRIGWILGTVALLLISSLFFHRFKVKEKFTVPHKKAETTTTAFGASFQLSNLTETPEFTSHLSPLIGAEILMLIRKSPKWLWGISFCLMLAMVFVPLSFAHHYMLPLLWFLQVGVWSDLVTKDTTFRTHYFTASSYRPLQRLFVSRIIAGICIALLIATPLLVRYLVELNFLTIINIMIGAIFIILLSVFFGTITRSKKLFEIVFFFLIYSNINLVSITDYFGAQHNSLDYTGMMFIISVLLFVMSYMIKKVRYDL